MTKVAQFNTELR